MPTVNPPAKPTLSTPTYCVHKRSQRAYVTIDGRQIPLGPANTQESRDAYERVVGQWLAAGRTLPASLDPGETSPPLGPTVTMLVERFWTHAKTFYRNPDGTVSSELECYKVALRVLRRLYGATPVAIFGPLMLKAVREVMIRQGDQGQRGWCRSNANRAIGRLKSVFKWGVETEIVPSHVYEALACVAGLRKGRTTARESVPVPPVPRAVVDRVVSFLPAPVAAVVKLQGMTGARGGELLQLRGCDFDQTNPVVWKYRPEKHKTAHKDKPRVIAFDPDAQDILRPFMGGRAPDAYLFSPVDAESERRAKILRVKTPQHIGNRPGTNRKKKPKRKPGDRYTSNSYRVAVTRACDKAFPPPAELTVPENATERQKAEAEGKIKAWRKAHRFHPHQLRHLRAKELRKVYGLDKTRAFLGHSTPDQAAEYAEIDEATIEQVALAEYEAKVKAREVAEKIE